MKISKENLIKLTKDEGCKLKAYKDSGGILTIGFGHTKGVKLSDVITIEQAYQYLHEDMQYCEDFLNSKKLALNQNQFDSLCSFTYNCGSGTFQKCLYNLIKENPNNEAIGIEMKKHVHDKKGTLLSGLIKRRNKEVSLYYSK